MKILNNLSGIIKNLITVFLLLCLTSGTAFNQLASDNTTSRDMRNLDMLIRKLNLNPNETPYLIYQNKSNTRRTSGDNIEVEYWMIDLSCWKSNKSKNLNDLLCIEEYELDYPVEDWMITQFDAEDPENPDEIAKDDSIKVESWMLTPDAWKPADNL